MGNFFIAKSLNLICQHMGKQKQMVILHKSNYKSITRKKRYIGVTKNTFFLF